MNVCSRPWPGRQAAGGRPAAGGEARRYDGGQTNTVIVTVGRSESGVIVAVISH